jgi:FlaA1/EpsC-like NDP-sugar epimerase
MMAWFAAGGVRRRVVLMAVESLLPLISVGAAAVIVYSGDYVLWPPGLTLAALILMLLQLLAGLLTRSFAGRWRFAGLRDAVTIVQSALLAGGAAIVMLLWLQFAGISLRLVIADTSIYILLSCGVRLGARWLHESARRTAASSRAGWRRAAIIGAGESGSGVIKNMLGSPKLLMDPVVVVDDDVRKHGSRLHSVPVLGPVSRLDAIVAKYHADEVIIAIPSATREQIGRIVDTCAAAKVAFRIAPDPEQVLNGHGGGGIRVVQPSDLLGRPQMDLNLDELRAELTGSRIAITGAAGSIGSELTRQLVKLRPDVLYLIDRNENDLYFLSDELEHRETRGTHVEVIQDVREVRRMTAILKELNPTHVLHAAAFKHVPLMESHLVEAVENNILGTWATLEAARAAETGKFVLISTDKAVHPTSVMGATKRFVELLVAEWTRETTRRSVIVRFGNVLGSNGSVVPLFQRQIAAGGPVTVTSRDATRYFMTTTEATQLVLQAVAMPEAVGKVAILDMGQPMRIWELAEQLIRMNGLRPGIDIEIAETGLRPGEKLHEELWWATENATSSRHPHIMLATVGAMAGNGGAPRSVSALIPNIRELVDRDDEDALRGILESAVGLSNGNGNRATPSVQVSVAPAQALRA